jgi:phosphoribosylformimino-5-aminoimidazole carboxamide ribotide isomerase
MLEGPNLAALEEVQRMSPFPVIASGGVTTLQDIRQLVGLGTAGAIIGRALYDGVLDLSEALSSAKS